MIKIEQLLQRWERWIAENLPAAIDTLRPGASDEATQNLSAKSVSTSPMMCVPGFAGEMGRRGTAL
jgi:cell wall assembly regulator SMI1